MPITRITEAKISTIYWVFGIFKFRQIEDLNYSKFKKKVVKIWKKEFSEIDMEYKELSRFCKSLNNEIKRLESKDRENLSSKKMIKSIEDKFIESKKKKKDNKKSEYVQILEKYSK